MICAFAVTKNNRDTKATKNIFLSIVVFIRFLHQHPLNKNRMKTTILKKIFLVAFVSLLFFVTAKAQIIYTDINPDHNGSYKLDLNNDNTNDFSFNSFLTNS